MIEFRTINKNYGKNKVLNGIDLQIPQGTAMALLGPNGSGKTTLLKCILGLVNFQAGDVLFNGDSGKYKWDDRSQVGYIPQIARFPENLKCRELLQLIKSLRNEKSHENELIEIFALEQYLDQPLKNLSGGTRQKMNITLGCMFKPEIIILDEPTAGLDPVAMINFRDYIKARHEQGTTILFTTHIMSLVETFAEEIVFLLAGQIFFQGTAKVLYQKTSTTDIESGIARLLSDNDKASKDKNEIGV